MAQLWIEPDLPCGLRFRRKPPINTTVLRNYPFLPSTCDPSPGSQRRHDGRLRLIAQPRRASRHGFGAIVTYGAVAGRTLTTHRLRADTKAPPACGTCCRCLA